MIIQGIGEIKAFVMDVDGTLTDGKIYIGQHGEVMKAFSVKDGLGIKKLLQTDIVPIILTGRESQITLNRALELGITEIYQGKENKVKTLVEICQKQACTYEQIVYIGDDENDLECMKLCGYVAVPSDACDMVQQCADYVCVNKGGNGAVRELIDRLI